jgi:hypothetical protein
VHEKCYGLFNRRYLLSDIGGPIMARAKQTSKRKGRRTLPAFGAAGMSLAVAGGASANAPTANGPSEDTASLPVITLGEEEISDVSLATFYVFDKENIQLGQGLKLAARGCGGCGCRGCAARGCRGCGGCGCAVRACRGCGCGGCAVRAWSCGGCAACGGGCAPCWILLGWSWVRVC